MEIIFLKWELWGGEKKKGEVRESENVMIDKCYGPYGRKKKKIKKMRR